MDAKISSTFWNDDTLAAPHLRLAALWLRTNPHVTNAGYGEFSLRRFVFETGLPSEALAECFQALGGRCHHDERAYWLRDFIGENFGRGEALSRNNFAKSVPRAIAHARCPWLAAAVYAEYPELTPDNHSATGPLPRGSAPTPTTGEEGEDREDREDREEGAEQRGSGVQGGRGEPTPAEAIYAAYPKKVGRADALRAIAAALRATPAAHLHERTAAFAAAVTRWPADRQRFIPHPATWFRRGSFDDDPLTWSAPDSAESAKNFGSGAPALSAPLYDPAKFNPAFLEATAP